MRCTLLDCGSMKPVGAWLMPSLFPGPIPSRCALIETEGGLVLIDTGFGKQDLADPTRLGPARKPLGIDYRQTRPAIQQVEELGHSPDAVRHIILTHMDLDHAGGVADFPWATVHVLREEHETANNPAPKDRARYRAVQWQSHQHWALYDKDESATWRGFPGVCKVQASGLRAVLVPAHGHTKGHAAVAVELAGGWMLHAGDSYYGRAEFDYVDRWTLILRAFQRRINHDQAQAIDTQRQLKAFLAESADVLAFASHESNPFPDGIPEAFREQVHSHSA